MAFLRDITNLHGCAYMNTDMHPFQLGIRKVQIVVVVIAAFIYRCTTSNEEGMGRMCQHVFVPSCKKKPQPIKRHPYKTEKTSYAMDSTSFMKVIVRVTEYILSGSYFSSP